MEALNIAVRLAIIFPAAGVIFIVCAIMVSAGIGLGTWLISNIPLMLDKWTCFGEKKRKEAEQIQQELKTQQKTLCERRYH